MTDIARAARPIGFGLVLAGLCFFFNPVFAVVDVLPDCIGCLLVWFGLSRVSRVSRPMVEARAAFLKLFVVYLVKDLFVMAIFGMSSDLERPSSLLIVAFAAAVLGLYFTITALRALFDGFYTLAVTHDCPPLYRKKEAAEPFVENTCESKNAPEQAKKRRFGEVSRTEAVLRLSLVFVLFREIVGVLPEFSALTSLEFNNGQRASHLYDYIGVMRAISAAIVLIAGIVWLVAVVRYFLLVRAQKELLVALGEEEERWRASHPGSALVKRYAVAFTLMTIGAALLTDFRVDYRNVLPDAVAAALLLAGLLVTDLPAKYKGIGGALAVVYGAIATVSEHFAYEFSVHHTGEEISKTAEAANAYLISWLTALAEFAVVLGLLVCLLLCLRRVIVKWAGYLPAHDDLPFEQRRRAAFLEEFDKELVRTFVFGFLAALCSFLFDYIQEIPDYRIFRLLEFFWGLDFAVNVLAAVMFGILLADIHGEIRHRFLYEAE